MFENIKITDIVSAGSALIAAITSVVMAVLAYRTYLKEPQETADVDEDKGQGSDSQIIDRLLIFKTSKQKTKLVIEAGELVCYLDDTREGRGGLQWRLSSEQARGIFAGKGVHANPNYRPRTGLVTIGPKRNWLYSKSLFPDHRILEEAVLSMLATVSESQPPA